MRSPLGRFGYVVVWGQAAARLRIGAEQGIAPEIIAR